MTTEEMFNTFRTTLKTGFSDDVRKCLSGSFELNDAQVHVVRVCLTGLKRDGTSLFDMAMGVMTICNFIVLNGRRVAEPELMETNGVLE